MIAKNNLKKSVLSIFFMLSVSIWSHAAYAQSLGHLLISIQAGCFRAPWKAATAYFANEAPKGVPMGTVVDGSIGIYLNHSIILTGGYTWFQNAKRQVYNHTFSIKQHSSYVLLGITSPPLFDQMSLTTSVGFNYFQASLQGVYLHLGQRTWDFKVNKVALWLPMGQVTLNKAWNKHFESSITLAVRLGKKNVAFSTVYKNFVSIVQNVPVTFQLMGGFSYQFFI